MPQDAALGELPGILAYAFGPEQLAFIIENDEAHIGPEPIQIYHNNNQILGSQAGGQTALATNLSNLQTRVAALPTLGDRTGTQAREAIKGKLDAGDADQ